MKSLIVTCAVTFIGAAAMAGQAISSGESFYRGESIVTSDGRDAFFEGIGQNGQANIYLKANNVEDAPLKPVVIGLTKITRARYSYKGYRIGDLVRINTVKHGEIIAKLISFYPPQNRAAFESKKIGSGVCDLAGVSKYVTRHSEQVTKSLESKAVVRETVPSTYVQATKNQYFGEPDYCPRVTVDTGHHMNVYDDYGRITVVPQAVITTKGGCP